MSPQRHKSGDIRRVGWRLANFTCKIVGKVQKLQPVWWKHLSRLNRPQMRIKLQQLVAMAVATTLCLHPTIGDPQRFRIVPAKSLRINVLSPWISGLLVGSHRGIILTVVVLGSWLTFVCSQLKWNTYPWINKNSRKVSKSTQGK